MTKFQEYWFTFLASMILAYLAETWVRAIWIVVAVCALAAALVEAVKGDGWRP